jgi:plasmid replication initiation protein
MQLVNKRDIRDRNVAKAQPLVEAAYNFSIWEKRVYTLLASLVDKNDPALKSYRINIKDIIDFYECKSHDAYERIREVPESLLSKNKIIQIPFTTEEGYKRVLKTHLINAVTQPMEGDRTEGNGYIELEFHPRLKPFLLGLKRYLCYDIKNTIGISSVHTLRIFEFLKLHQYKGKYEITVQDLKVMLGLENKHKKYGHFKRVIKKAQKDLEKHTDIRFEFEEIKQGRAVFALLFFIYENIATEEVPATVKAPTAQGNSSTNLKDGERLYQLVKDWGITRETFLGFMEQYALEHIKERITYIQQLPKKKAIRNKAAYLRTLLEQPTLFTTPKITKQQKKKSTQQRQQQQAQVEQHKKRLVELRKQQSKAENAIIDQLFQKENTTLKQIITQTKKSRLAKNKYNTDLTDEENFYENAGFQLFVYAEAKKTYPELLRAVQAEFEQEIGALKKML